MTQREILDKLAKELGFDAADGLAKDIGKLSGYFGCIQTGIRPLAISSKSAILLRKKYPAIEWVHDKNGKILDFKINAEHGKNN